MKVSVISNDKGELNVMQNPGDGIKSRYMVTIAVFTVIVKSVIFFQLQSCMMTMRTTWIR